MTSQIFSKSKGTPGPAQPEIHVGAFGKHPAWNDFIDDPGIDTDRLVAVKRVLFLEGIGAAIETGAWDKLEPAQKIDGFGHLVIWRSRGEIVVVRLWSSSDGKGRTKYPMAVAAQCRGMSLAWVLVETLPRLERLERRCRDATTQEQVAAALGATRQELRARAAVAERGAPIQSGAVAEVAGELSPEGSREPYYRLMYQIERDWGAYLLRRSDTSSATRSGGVGSAGIRPQHARVPSGVGTVEEVIIRWMHFILNLVDNATSITLIRSTDASSGAAVWTDVIVGEPEGPQFFCIRASEQSLPLATSIPYTLDADFRKRCDKLVDDSRSGQLAEQRPEVVTASATGLLDRVKGLLGGKRKSLLVLLLAAGLVGTGVGIAMYFSADGPDAAGSVRGGGAGPRADAPREHPPPSSSGNATNGDGSEESGGGPLASAAEASDWRRLCAAYHGWFAEFMQRLQKRPGAEAGAVAAGFSTRAEFYATDPYLKGLLDRLNKVHAAGRSIDPWSIAGVAKSHDLADLASNPPSVVAEEDVRARIEEAAAIVDGFSTRLPSEWPALKSLSQAAVGFELVGLDAEARFVESLVSRVASVPAEGSGGRTGAIDAVLGAAGVVEEVLRGLATREACAQMATATRDPLLGRFATWAAGEAAPGGDAAADLASLEDLSHELRRVTEVAEPLLSFLREGWRGTDAALVARRVATDPEINSAEPNRESFLLWLAVAKASPKLDAALDPRRTGKVEEMLGGARAARGRLREFSATPDARLVELQASVEAGVAALGAMPFNAETKDVVRDGVDRLEAQARELRQGWENAVAVEGARRAGTAREVREGLAAQQTIVARSESVNEAWRSRRDALLGATPDESYPQLRVDADALRTALAALDAAIPAGLEAAGSDMISRAVAASSWELRERVVKAVVEKWEGIRKDAGGASLAEEGKRAGAEFGRQRAALESFARDARVVAAHVAMGASMRERTESGEPLTSLVERWRRSEAMRTEGVAMAARPLLQEVEALERVESLVGANELADAAEEALPDRWPLALASWRRLGRLTAPAWPDSLGALQREAEVSGKLLAAVAAAGGVRRAELEREINEQREARWTRAFAALSDSGEIELAAALASDMGVAGSLSGASRYNLELAMLRRAARAGVLTDEQARERASRFEREVRGMAGGIAELPGVEQLLERLGPIAGDAPEEKPAVAVTSLGPGSAAGALSGFVGVVEGDVLRFAHPGGANGAITLEFMRVDPVSATPDAGETFFIATTEVSLGQLIAIVDLAGAWKDLGELFVSTDPEDDFRKGPRAWRWSDDGARGAVMRPAEKWLRELATGRKVADYPRGMNPGAPGLDHPVNYIPPAAALFVAHLGGCRLPTLEEWKAAAAKVGAMKHLQRCNLRDQQWKAEQAHISEIARTGSVNWPDDDVFMPIGKTPRLQMGPNAGSHPWDDGALWMSETNRPSGGAAGDDRGIAIHLVGNVAEMVMDVGAGELIPAPGGASANDARAIITHHRRALRVVGGSALSPVEVVPDEAAALDLNEAAGGYADVGFRLAFSAVGVGPVKVPLGLRLARALSEARYIPQGSGK